MSVLPAFWTLSGRPAILVGGGEAAAQKLRYLARAGADIAVFAQGEPVQAEIAEAAAEGRITLHTRELTAADAEDAALAVVAVAGDAAAEAAIAVLRAARVPLNAVDRPNACDFIVPAIVDRSPVVVGISTGGTAPVLARRVRAAVERALPAGIGRLAAFADGFRGAVRAMLPNGPARKRFWEDFFDGPAAADVLAGRESRARERTIQQLNAPAARKAGTGRVILVGAGPGDPDLLTLKALQALQAADVVLYDRLVGDGIVDYARRDAERVRVGKRPGDHALSQDGINELMVAHARAGRTVVRLKGGDPFVFGRGGEETDHLEAAGLAVEVVPGITAATGAGAATGIPLTHRDEAQAVTFVTGSFKGGAPELDWRALANPAQTVVVYMGVGTAATVAENLIAHGAPADRPVAVVEKASLPDQRVLPGRLGDLGRLVAANAVTGPALLIVGEVARRADAADPVELTNLAGRAGAAAALAG